MIALAAEMIRRLRGLHIRGFGPGLCHDTAEPGRVFQHGAGLQHILVEGLPVVVGLEQRPTYSASFWKSMAKRGFLLRYSRMR